MAVEQPCGDPGPGAAGSEAEAVRRGCGGGDPAAGDADRAAGDADRAESDADRADGGRDAAGVGSEPSGAVGDDAAGYSHAADAAAGDGSAAEPAPGEVRAPSDAGDERPGPGSGRSRAADPRVLRRLAEVFGDLPRVTSDELGLDEPALDRGSSSETERELLANRPPHHDRD